MIVIDNNKIINNLHGQSSCQHTGATIQFVGALFASLTKLRWHRKLDDICLLEDSRSLYMTLELKRKPHTKSEKTFFILFFFYFFKWESPFLIYFNCNMNGKVNLALPYASVYRVGNSKGKKIVLNTRKRDYLFSFC